MLGKIAVEDFGEVPKAGKSALEVLGKIAPPLEKEVQKSSASSTKYLRGYSSQCESGHWLESVNDDGSIIKLENGSIWEVNGADTVDSSLWFPPSNIIVCDGKLINTDDKETVEVTQIR